MKVVQVVPRIADESSGPSQSVPGLSRALSDAGAEVDLYVLEPRPERKTFERLTAFPSWPGSLFRRLGVSPRMKAALSRAAGQVDVIHTNSLWMMPNVYPAAAVAGTNCRLVISPRGTLSDWALNRARWRKKLIGWWGQHQALREAHCLHATANEELNECRRLGLTNPVAIIPNGLDCPAPPSVNQTESNGRTLLFLSRIHPKKGIDQLLRAWSRLEGDFADWNLTVAGPDNHEFAKEMKSLAAELGLERVKFIGEVTGGEKEQVYRRSDLFVLPTHNENFGIAVAEALAHGVPAVVSTGAPWSGLKEERCGWWFELSDEGLLTTLREAMRSPSSELESMGQRGYQWMKRSFSWPAIGERMRRTYEWLCEKGDRPDWVHLG